MSNQIQIFNSPQFGSIRTAGTADNPQFCLADICKVLELQVSATKNRLKKDGVNSIKVIDSLGREQSALFISEQNLYKVIMRSDKQQAEAFQDWVCGEVLPTIRKTGGYIATAPDMSAEEIMAKALIVAQRTIEQKKEEMARLERENATLRANSDYLNIILQAKETITITQIAQDYGMSPMRLNKILNDLRIQRKVNAQWVLFAPYLGKGYVQSETITYRHTDGRIGTKLNTRWTNAGRIFLYNVLKEQGILPLIEQTA